MPEVAEVNGESSVEMLRRNPSAFKGRAAGPLERKQRQVVRLYGQLDVSASAGKVDLANQHHLRILQMDPYFTTDGITSQLLWNTLAKAYGERSKSEINEDIFRRLLEAGGLPRWLRHWREVHGTDPEAGDPYLVSCLHVLQQNTRAAFELGRRYLEQSLLSAGSAEQQRWRFEQLLEVLVSCDRHLVPYQEVWEIVQQLLLGSPDLKPEEAYELTLEAFQAAGDLQGVQESRSRLARSQEESPAQVVPRITNFTKALQALGVPFTEPTATPSRSRELFRYVRKKRRQAIWRDPFGPQTPEESPAEPQAEVNASAVEAGLFQLLASGAPFWEVKLKLKEAVQKDVKLDLAVWTSVTATFAASADRTALEETHQLFQAAKLPLTSRDDFHRAMGIAAEAGDWELVADLFHRMGSKGFPAEEDSYSMIFKACSRGSGHSRKTAAIRYFSAMLLNNIQPQRSTLDAVDQVVGKVQRMKLLEAWQDTSGPKRREAAEISEA